MILNILNDIWNYLEDLSDNFYDFIMKNFEQPFLWIFIVIIFLVIFSWGISKFPNK